MSDQRNLILAIVASVVIVLGFQYFIERPKVRQAQQPTVTQTVPESRSAPGGPQAPSAPAPSSAPPVPRAAAPGVAERTVALEKGARVRIESPRLKGSLSLVGARIDDLALTTYKVDLSKDSRNIVVLSPVGAGHPYYAEQGWTMAPGGTARLPDSTTRWQASGDVLSPDRPLTLTWDNGEGLKFTRTYKLDRDYMFTITQTVENRGTAEVQLYPYALISRHGTPKTTGFYILHEGALGVFDGKLSEVDYTDMADRESEADKGPLTQRSTGGWIGFTDKYWLTALIPDQSKAFTGRFIYDESNGGKYQVDYLRQALTVPAGGSAAVTDRFFAGAKEVLLLDRYRDEEGVTRFDLAIDWGWFYFLTRPLFFAIDYFYRLLGNFGLAILVVTVIIKILFLPLAHKSYVSMSKMKKLQPEMVKLRERFGDDKQKLNQEMMALYKREKANPASGCLPMILQIPVFFALYKVLFVTIEMRHAPFYGWIRDLSAPDPTNVLNLFGLIPWDPPAIIPALGVWPLLMGLSMFLQQKLNPQPADPVQAKIFMFMPLFFTVLLANFPAGLVIYWTWNNLLSMAQQRYIMWRMKVPA